MIEWNAISAVAAVISTVAIVVSALYVRAQLKNASKDRYLAITNQLFAVWETSEFMAAQLWLVHRLRETSWEDFVKAHRGDVGEAAFHRVGAFYDRVGLLIRLGFVNVDDILPTVGGYAIAVWQKVGPLVYQARALEHSTLFTEFERMLPACQECYVPTVAAGAQVRLFTPSSVAESPRIDLATLRKRLDAGEPLTLLDVRRADQVAHEPATLPGAVVMPAEEVEKHYQALSSDREVVAFCA